MTLASQSLVPNRLTRRRDEHLARGGGCVAGYRNVRPIAGNQSPTVCVTRIISHAEFERRSERSTGAGRARGGKPRVFFVQMLPTVVGLLEKKGGNHA